jgi:hypothetical protein
MRVMIAVVLVLTGCTTLGPGQSGEDEMMNLAAALTKVSAATEANLLYGASSDTLSDGEFLFQSVAHDPGLLKPFASYQIKAMRQNGHTAILVCSENGAVALLEDAGCTAAMDRQRWKDVPPEPCVFTIDLAQLCAAVPH